jgi:hypothetical protein
MIIDGHFIPTTKVLSITEYASAMNTVGDERKSEAVVGLLLVNKIRELPSTAINSILVSSSCKIVIGYIHEQDLEGLPKSDRIVFQKLDLADIGVPLLNSDSDGYSGWFTENFFRIVQLKWTLIENLLNQQYETVLYSDLDVVWLSDMAHHMDIYFNKFSEVDAAFQSFTYDPANPKLCMGFVAFRNTDQVKDLINQGHQLHSKMLLVDHRFGDDDAITALYQELNYPSWMRELPQTSVAVGSTININTKRSKFPGLTGLQPHLFHANFAVGELNKRLLIRLSLPSEMRRALGIPLSFKWQSILLGKKVKFLLSRIL